MNGEGSVVCGHSTLHAMIDASMKVSALPRLFISVSSIKLWT